MLKFHIYQGEGQTVPGHPRGSAIPAETISLPDALDEVGTGFLEIRGMPQCREIMKITPGNLISDDKSETLMLAIYPAPMIFVGRPSPYQ
jgi:hypothetical protein